MRSQCFKKFFTQLPIQLITITFCFSIHYELRFLVHDVHMSAIYYLLHFNYGLYNNALEIYGLVN
jgi:hypothetical protein